MKHGLLTIIVIGMSIGIGYSAVLEPRPSGKAINGLKASIETAALFQVKGFFSKRNPANRQLDIVIDALRTARLAASKKRKDKRIAIVTYMQEHKAKGAKEVKHSSDWNDVLRAIENADLARVQALVPKHISVNNISDRKRDGKKLTILEIADYAVRDQDEIVKFLTLLEKQLTPSTLETALADDLAVLGIDAGSGGGGCGCA